jgi:hypothetical protein
MKFSNNLVAGFCAVVAAFVFSGAASAQNYVVVTPTNTQGWTTADTTAGGTVQFVADPSAPRGGGALRLTTDATTTAKAQYLHPTSTPLADVTDLSYYTKQVAASFPQGDASFQLVMCLEGATDTTCNGFTTLVFEPYENTDQGPVITGVWQQWDVDAGQFWSTRTYDGAGSCDVTAGAGGAPFYTLEGLTAACPDAVVVGFGVNVGSNNPSYDINVDLVRFNDTIYDFQLYAVPQTAADCKGLRWRSAQTETGEMFPNQGQCVSYVKHHDGNGNDGFVNGGASPSKP